MSSPGDDRGDARFQLGLGALFLVTGATALIYQVVWSRQLQLLLGGSTTATSAVLTAFMGGFALGAAVLGGRADQVRRPLRLYGALELGVGVSALFVPLVLAGLEPVYAALARQGAGLGMVRFLVAVGVLLFPTALMGASLPAVIAEVTRAGGPVARSLGWLYGLNLLGALTGALLAGFLMIRELGLGGATRVAVAANVGVGLVACLVARERPQAPPRALAAGVRVSRLDPLLLPLLFLSGFVVLALEVVWTRTLVFSLGNTVHGFALVLAVTLAGLAVGAALAPRLLEGGDPGTRLAWTHLGVAVSGALGFALAPRMFDLMLWVAPGYGGGAFVLASILASAVVLFVPASLAGVSFPALAALETGRSRASGGAVGRAQAINGLGSILGAAGAGLLLIPALGLGGALGGLLMLELLAAALLFRGGPSRRAPGAWLVAAACTVGILGATSLRRADALDGVLRAEAGGAAPRLIAFREGRVSTASVLEDARGRSLRLDGFEAAAIGGSYGYMRLMGLIPLALQPAPSQALVICFGTGTTTSAVSQDPRVERLRVVELEPVVLELASLFTARNRGVLDDPRVEAVAEDGRAYLVGAEPESLDLITLEPMPPNHAGVVTLYSVEFYERAAQALRPGGVIAQWLPTQFLRDVDARAIVASMRDVFPEVSLFMQHATGIVVGVKQGGQGLELEALTRRLASSPELVRELAECGVEGAEGLAERCALGPEATTRYVAGARRVTDDFPLIEHAPARHRRVPLVGAHTPWQHEALRAIYEGALAPAPWLSAQPALDEARRLGFARELVQLDLERGRPQDARDRLEKLGAELHTNRARAGAMLVWVNVAWLSGDQQAARERLLQAAALDPDHPWLGQARAALGSP